MPRDRASSAPGAGADKGPLAAKSQRPGLRNYAALAAAALGFAALPVALWGFLKLRAPGPDAVKPEVVIAHFELTGLGEKDQWLASGLPRLIGQEIADGWGVEVDVEARLDGRRVGIIAVSGGLTRDAAGRLQARIAVKGGAGVRTYEQTWRWPRDMAVKLAENIVESVPPVHRGPSH